MTLTVPQLTLNPALLSLLISLEESAKCRALSEDDAADDDADDDNGT
jgi:hypothetical protein